MITDLFKNDAVSILNGSGEHAYIPRACMNRGGVITKTTSRIYIFFFQACAAFDCIVDHDPEEGSAKRKLDMVIIKQSSSVLLTYM